MYRKAAILLSLLLPGLTGSGAWAAQAPCSTPIAVAVPPQAGDGGQASSSGQKPVPDLKGLETITAAKLDGVNFSTLPEASNGLRLPAAIDTSERYFDVLDAEAATNLGVAIEGVAITLGEAKSANWVTRFKLGPKDQFRFYRDIVYEPQAYLRTREIELGAAPRQGESDYKPLMR